MAWVNLSGAFGYGTILTSTQMQNLRDNIAAAFAKDSGAPVLADEYVVHAMVTGSVENPGIGSIKYGTYTGNGSTDQGVAGIGFLPRAVLVFSVSDTSNKSGYLLTHEMTGTICLDIATGMLVSNALISLDADGFSVSDGGTDAHPNTNTHGYGYIAWS